MCSVFTCVLLTSGYRLRKQKRHLLLYSLRFTTVSKLSSESGSELASVDAKRGERTLVVPRRTEKTEEDEESRRDLRRPSKSQVLPVHAKQ